MKIKRVKRKSPLQQAVAEALQSVESEIEFRKLMVVEELLRRMKRNGINKGQLAQRMGVANSRVTAMLSGDSNLTIDTLVRAGRAVGADLVQTFVPHGQKGVWVERKPAKARENTGIVYTLQGVHPQTVNLGVGSGTVAKEDSGRAA